PSAGSAMCRARAGKFVGMGDSGRVGFHNTKVRPSRRPRAGYSKLVAPAILEGGTLPRRFVPLMISVVIVVEDRPDTLRGEQEGITARAAQVDEEGLVRLHLHVAVNRACDVLGGLSGVERHRY